ncbi:MAG: ribonuclease HII [Patescibacteria group bacterium]
MEKLIYEKKLWESGVTSIAGVDEVGRGCLAGPMVVASVILNKDHFTANTKDNSLLMETYVQIKDSKKISSKKRDYLSEFIHDVSINYSIEIISHEIIDNSGISHATQMGFYNAFKKSGAQHILTDMFEIKGLAKNKQTNIKGGDNLSLTIAAASIVAKVFRDNLMIELNEKYKNYGFSQHKGYGTKMHKEAIEKYGPCEIHRMSFEPLKSLKI